MADLEKLRHYASRLRDMPLKTAARKALGKLREARRWKAEAAQARRRGTEISQAELIEFLKPPSAQWADLPLAARLRGERFMLLSPSRRPDFAALFASRRPAAHERIIAQANEILAGRLEILGFRGEIPEPIWNIDPKSGKRWSEAAYYREIPTAAGDGSDIKMPWELSRCHHLTTVAQAFALTGQRRFLSFFEAQWRDWRAHNKPKFGCNWVCTMDVAIRAVNWIIATELLWDSLDDDLVTQFYASILEHARHIISNLEYGEEITSNHYLSDVAGLLWIAAAFPAFRDSDAWLAFALQEISSEMGRQVLPDGGDFEASTCYHRLVAEIFLSCAAVALRLPAESLESACRVSEGALPRLREPEKRGWSQSGLVFPEAFWARLGAMLAFTEAISDSSGRVPQIGDNDSGRLHRLTPSLPDEAAVAVADERESAETPDQAAQRASPNKSAAAPLPEEDSLDHRHLFGLALSAFRSEELERLAGPYAAESDWLGEAPEGAPRWDAAPAAAPAEIKKEHFGLFGVRTSQMLLLIRAGPVGQNGLGGHAHNDQLSLTLSALGRAVLVDPGTYCYTPDPEARNRFRSTQAHNTVCLPGLEQNEIRPGLMELFRLASSRPGRCVEASLDGRGAWSFHGQFLWPNGVLHVRRVRVETGGVIDVVDTLEPGGPGREASPKAADPPAGRLNLCVGPSIAVRIEGRTARLDLGRASLDIEFSAPARAVRRLYSPRYGAAIECAGLEADFAGRLEWRIRIGE